MAGRKISRANMQRIQEIANHAHAMGAKGPEPDRTPLGGKAEMSLNDQLSVVARAVYANALAPMDGYCCIEETFDTYVIIEICQSGAVETYWRADYTIDEAGSVTLAARDAWVQVEEVWQPVGNTAKAGIPLDIEGAAQTYATLKALGNRQIEVKVAYGGHKGGRDSHGEYFSARTDFDTENFPSPPLLYYHGYSETGKKMARPVVTGSCVSRRAGTDGHYLTYQLKTGKYADLQWDSAQAGKCVVSPGTVGHLIRKAADGHLDYWPLAEVSAWDYDGKRAPANLHSVAAPVLKAAYLEAGIDLPPTLDLQPPETAGDAVSAGTDISDNDAARFIVAQVASAVLARKA